MPATKTGAAWAEPGDVMSADRENNGPGFLDRWSRLKTEARQPAPAEEVRVPAKAEPQGEPPELPPIDKLTLDSDFSGFFHPKVDEDLRRAALRKLFSDPHFNVMDGLDTYIDDYSKSEPIPAAMLAGMKQAQRILEWAADKGEEAQGDSAAKPDVESAAPPEDLPPALEDARSDEPAPAVSVPDRVSSPKT